MSEIWGHLIGVMIVIMIVSFLGMWIWVWQKRHKPTFDQLSSIPMQDAVDFAEEKNK